MSKLEVSCTDSHLFQCSLNAEDGLCLWLACVRTEKTHCTPGCQRRKVTETNSPEPQWEEEILEVKSEKMRPSRM